MSNSNSNLILFISIIIVVFSFHFYSEHFTNEVEYVRSSIDNMYYTVQNLPNKEQACDLLAEVNSRVKKLLHHLREKYNNDATVNRLCKNYNEHQLSENSPDSRYTSYSVNKGEKIILCLRHKNDKEHTLMDVNTVMFVVIHELAHLCSVSVGHTEEFWANMKKLLKEAIKIKIYQYVPYHQKPQQYCGTLITDTPYKR